MALGSSIRQAMLDVGSSGVAAAGFGLIAGLALSFLALRVLRSELFGVRDCDPLTLTIVTVVIAVIATAASFLLTLRITNRSSGHSQNGIRAEVLDRGETHCRSIAISSPASSQCYPGGHASGRPPSRCT